MLCERSKLRSIFFTLFEKRRANFFTLLGKKEGVFAPLLQKETRALSRERE